MSRADSEVLDAAPVATDERAACDAMRAEGTRLVASGSMIGLATVASTVLLGATCPLCIVGVPALIGFGVFQRVRGELLHRQLERESGSEED